MKLERIEEIEARWAAFAHEEWVAGGGKGDVPDLVVAIVFDDKGRKHTHYMAVCGSMGRDNAATAAAIAKAKIDTPDLCTAWREERADVERLKAGAPVWISVDDRLPDDLPIIGIFCEEQVSEPWQERMSLILDGQTLYELLSKGWLTHWLPLPVTLEPSQ